MPESHLQKNADRARRQKSEVVKVVEEMEKENRQLRRQLTILVERYIANRGSKSQFVSCITPEGNMREWDDAMKLLGMPLDPNRKFAENY
jgi:hypothetical protein